MTRELFTVVTPAEALSALEVWLPEASSPETIPTTGALDRVLAADVVAPEDLPSFVRSTMDGFAVRAADTFGAGEALPGYLTVRGEIAIGETPDVKIASGECARISTGGMLPEGADAVVMVERTESIDDRTIEVLKPAAPGENTIAIAEDVHAGELVLRRGHRLRPQDLGGLHALGITEVDVARTIRVAIVGSGDEIVPPTAVPTGAQIRDVNSTTLAGLVVRSGHLPVQCGIHPDDRAHLEQAAREALDEADVLILSAGSSVSARDMTADVIEALGEPGILVHGVALKPGKPTILAVCNGKPVFGLPGNPVSCMVTFDLFVAPTLARMSGATATPRRVVRGVLTMNVASKAGREDYVAARIVDRDGETAIAPVFSKSNLIFSLVRADGMIRIPAEKNGVSEGEIVEIVLF